MSISIRHLSFAYGDLPVLREFTAEALAGRITAVLGPNAVGKSTLLRCAAGLLRPDAGEVMIDGKEARSLGSRRLAACIAYVPQRSIVSAAFTVREVVELGRYALGRNAARVEEALDRLKLGSIADRPYQALSVGQQQRVSVARALAQLSPSGRLILDEPTSAMDLRHQRDCLGLLRELADRGVTVLLAVHDITAAAVIADDVWLMGAGQPGRLMTAGPVEEVMRVDRLEEVFGVGFEWFEQTDGRRILIAETPPTGDK